MAVLLERVASANPDALVLGYGGSVHMSHNDVPRTAIPSAAGRLPRSETVSVFVEGEDGSAWICVNNECRPHPQSPQSQVCKPGVREVVPLPNGGLPAGFDAVACIGRPLTASPPAVPASGK